MNETFSQRLKKYRKAKNMTQQELSEVIGVSDKTVSRWESEGGYPDVTVLVPLARALGELYPEKKLVFLTGVLADKNWSAMVGELLPLAKEFVAITPDSPRAMPAQDLAEYMENQGVKAVSCETVQEGVDRAMEAAGPEGAVCVCGSLYIIGEARHLLGLC